MTTTAVTIVISFTAPTFAQELPRFDVKAHCLSVANFSGAYSAVIEKGCFDLEQSSYDLLKPNWQDLPSPMREHCTQVASFAGPGSYQILQGCVQMEQEASGQNETSTFDY